MCSRRLKLPEEHPVTLPQPQRPSNWSLLPWQKEVFQQAKHLRAVALYLEQGVGKTLTALELVRYWKSSDSFTDPLLVIAPLTSIELVWRPVLEQLGIPYALVHPEALTKHRKAFAKHRWGACIVDEAHGYKNPNSKRSKALEKLAYIPRKLILTGTPMEKDPVDFWAQFRFLVPGLLERTWTSFKRSYMESCGFKNKQWRIRKGRLEEYLKLIRPYIFDVRRREVMDIQSKRVIARVGMTTEQRRIYDELEEHLIAEYEDGVITAPQAAVKLIKLHQIACGFVYDDTGSAVMVGDLKLKKALKYINQKTVIFCRYSSEIEGLSRYLKHHGITDISILDGSIPPKERKSIVDQFTKKKFAVLIVQVRVGGVSINLQSAARAIFYSLPMSRTDFEQARARLLRYGQGLFVDFIILLTRDSVDENVYALLKSKGRMIDMVRRYLKNRRRK